MAYRKILYPPFPPTNFTVAEIRAAVGDLSKVVDTIEGRKGTKDRATPSRTKHGSVAFMKVSKPKGPRGSRVVKNSARTRGQR